MVQIWVQNDNTGQEFTKLLLLVKKQHNQIYCNGSSRLQDRGYYCMQKAMTRKSLSAAVN